MKAKVFIAQLCPTLCDPKDCSLPGSSDHGTFQAKILEWVAILFSRGSFQPRDRTWVYHTECKFFTIFPIGLHKEYLFRECPGGPLVRSLRFYCQGPLSGTKISQDEWWGQKKPGKKSKNIPLANTHQFLKSQLTWMLDIYQTEGV